MRFVVLQAHPLQDSLNAVLGERVTAAIKTRGHETQLVRLTQGEWINSASLVGAEALVFVYPTWWGGLPAPMLRWVQQELAAWIDGPSGLDSSPLRTVRHLLAVTTHGSSGWVNRLQGEPGRHLLKRSVARLCASGTRLRWIALYGIDRREQSEISAFVDRATTEIVRITG